MLYFTHWGEKTPCRIYIKFCTTGDIRDVITAANFGIDRFRGLSVARGQILGFSIGFRRRPYNTLALPCECVIMNHCQLVLTKSKNCMCWEVHQFFDSNRPAGGLEPNILLEVRTYCQCVTGASSILIVPVSSFP